MERLFIAMTFIAALGSGLMAGLFFIFSVTIMRAFAAIPPPAGIAAMQSINRTIVAPAFLSVFFGTALFSAVLAVVSVLRWAEPGTGWLLVGAGLYLLGGIAVTMAFNVPLNNALERVAPDSAEGAKLWQVYLVEWTRWNHLRTAACIAAAACFMLALRA
jgi:uncharacterized membrane protein